MSTDLPPQDLAPQFPVSYGAVPPGGTTPLPNLVADWSSAVLGGRPASDLAGILQAARPRVLALRDPFAPLIQGDAAARQRETVLWEDGDVIAVVDLGGTTALVMPKAAGICFVTELQPEVVYKLALTSAALSDAFLALGATGIAHCWINPPGGLGVSRLHVHVAPQFAWTADRAGVWGKVCGLLT